MSKYDYLAGVALEARNNAYAPYSSFTVGAALLASSGKVYIGSNIENVSYSPTLCAERSAYAAAVSAGERKFLAIAIAGGLQGEEIADYCTPCGVCRQVMAEFDDGNMDVILVKTQFEYKIMKLNELLPHAFSVNGLLKI
jgi:cytidine deaminase